MQHRFSWFAVAEEVFSANGLCFASAEYEQFAAAWNFKKNNLITTLLTIKWTGGKKNYKNYNKHTKEMPRPIIRITNPSN